MVKPRMGFVVNVLGRLPTSLVLFLLSVPFGGQLKVNINFFFHYQFFKFLFQLKITINFFIYFNCKVPSPSLSVSLSCLWMYPVRMCVYVFPKWLHMHAYVYPVREWVYATRMCMCMCDT